jgi:hypothetical protein
MSIDNVLSYLRTVFSGDDAVAGIARMKTSFDGAIIEDSSAIILSPLQQNVKDANTVPADCDLVDHIPEYDNEECRWILRVLEAFQGMTDVEARDEAYVRGVLPEIDLYSKMEGVTWDKKRRDTTVRIRRAFSTAKPKRLARVPMSLIREHLVLMNRHTTTPFQSCHMTVTQAGAAIAANYMETEDHFIMTLWIGPMGAKITEAGTAYRSKHFPGAALEKKNIREMEGVTVGQRVNNGTVTRIHEDGSYDVKLDAPDHANRILFYNLPPGKDLDNAWRDFETAYTSEDPSATVPVLIQLEHF